MTMKTLLYLSIALGMALSIAACGSPAGTPCETVGSGFTASHDCQHRCLSRWQVTCPDGERVTPGMCSGAFECTPGSCPDGQVCYHDTDPFDDRSFCVADNTCGDLSDEELVAWERQTVENQQAVIEARLEKEARRKKWREENLEKSTTAPAVDLPPKDE